VQVTRGRAVTGSSRKGAKKAAQALGGRGNRAGGVEDGVTTAAPPVVARIAMWSIDRLHPLARNPREHSPEQIEEIAESIRRYGFLVPVIVNEKQGKVLAGNGRVAAAQRLGLREVPVVGVGHLSEAEQLAFIVADNTIATHATWNEEVLAEYFTEIERLGLDPAAMTFFSEEEVEAILSEFADAHATVVEDEAPAPPEEPVSRSGDLWCLGEHRVLCGDATVLDDVRRVVPVPATMCFTDPPYDIAYRGSGRQVAEGNQRAPIANDNLGADWPAFIGKVLANVLASTRGGVYICIGWQRLGTLLDVLVAAGGHVSTVICWAKNHFVLGGGDFNPQFELIAYAWREGSERVFNGGDGESNLWSIDRPAASPLHPTSKPVELVARAIANSSLRGDAVLDVCAGSGTTVVAAEQLGRRCAAVELDPAYVDVIVTRWMNLTGGAATFEATGQTFAEVAVDRGVAECR